MVSVSFNSLVESFIIDFYLMSMWNTFNKSCLIINRTLSWIKSCHVGHILCVAAVVFNESVGCCTWLFPTYPMRLLCTFYFCCCRMVKNRLWQINDRYVYLLHIHICIYNDKYYPIQTSFSEHNGNINGIIPHKNKDSSAFI